MHISVYEHDRRFVIEKLLQGEFDYVDTADEVFEADFFSLHHWPALTQRRKRFG